jgi:hypothetical protein
VVRVFLGQPHSDGRLDFLVQGQDHNQQLMDYGDRITVTVHLWITVTVHLGRFASASAAAGRPTAAAPEACP